MFMEILEKFINSKFYFLLSNHKILYFTWFTSTILFSFIGFFMDFPNQELINKNILNGSVYLVSLALVGSYFTNLLEQMRSDFNELMNGQVKEFFINIKFLLLFLLFIAVLLLMKMYSILEYRTFLKQFIAFSPIFVIGIWIYSLVIFDEVKYLKYKENRLKNKLTEDKEKKEQSFNTYDKKVDV